MKSEKLNKPSYVRLLLAVLYGSFPDLVEACRLYSCADPVSLCRLLLSYFKYGVLGRGKLYFHVIRASPATEYAHRKSKAHSWQLLVLKLPRAALKHGELSPANILFDTCIVGFNSEAITSVGKNCPDKTSEKVAVLCRVLVQTTHLHLYVLL